MIRWENDILCQIQHIHSFNFTNTAYNFPWNFCRHPAFSSQDLLLSFVDDSTCPRPLTFPHWSKCEQLCCHWALLPLGLRFFVSALSPPIHHPLKIIICFLFWNDCEHLTFAFFFFFILDKRDCDVDLEGWVCQMSWDFRYDITFLGEHFQVVSMEKAPGQPCLPPFPGHFIISFPNHLMCYVPCTSACYSCFFTASEAMKLATKVKSAACSFLILHNMAVPSPASSLGWEI